MRQADASDGPPACVSIGIERSPVDCLTLPRCCKHGHPLSPENVCWFRNSRGTLKWQCRECHRYRARCWERRRRLALRGTALVNRELAAERRDQASLDARDLAALNFLRYRSPKFRGVEQDPDTGEWVAMLRKNGRGAVEVGRFPDEVSAWRGYQQARSEFKKAALRPESTAHVDRLLRLVQDLQKRNPMRIDRSMPLMGSSLNPMREEWVETRNYFDFDGDYETRDRKK